MLFRSVNYKIYEKDGKPAMMETIKAAYTAQFSENPIASRRLKIANEGAIRNSIARLLDKLKTLK